MSNEDFTNKATNLTAQVQESRTPLPMTATTGDSRTPVSMTDAGDVLQRGRTPVAMTPVQTPQPTQSQNQQNSNGNGSGTLKK